MRTERIRLPGRSWAMICDNNEGQDEDREPEDDTCMARTKARARKEREVR